MKKLLLILIVIIYCSILQAQNLVPNCSFEDTIHCPNGYLGEIADCKDWYSAGTVESTPDYFKACGQYPTVPYNPAGFQYAANGGNAYTGIVPWIKDPTLQNEKEYIGTKLIEPLTIGQKYYVSFKVNLTVGIATGYASNKTGVLFSTKKYDNANPASVRNFAHIYTNKIITDTANWTTISGCVTADSAYQYLSIGDFFDNAHTDTIKVYQSQYNNNISYYYIDEVCVSIDSSKCSCNTGDNIKGIKHITQINAYYNSKSNEINIKNSLFPIEEPEISIYDVTGKLIYKSILHAVEYKIPTRDFISGIYLINIKCNKTLYNFKLFIN